MPQVSQAFVTQCLVVIAFNLDLGFVKWWQALECWWQALVEVCWWQALVMRRLMVRG
jgi:hypothetical protein